MAKTGLRKKLWDLCRQITRLTYQRTDGTWTCYTCKRHLIEPAKAQTGHFIPDAAGGAYLRYDLRNLRIQCYQCNISLGGNGAEFYRQLVIDEGQDYVDQLFRDKHITIKADDWWYKKKIEEYELHLSRLQKGRKSNI